MIEAKPKIRNHESVLISWLIVFTNPYPADWFKCLIRPRLLYSKVSYMIQSTVNITCVFE